jgi:hypothetical protein
MKLIARFLFAGWPALAAGAALAASPGAQSVPVLSQDLASLKGTKGVSAALWTRRPDSYTLQLVLPVSGSRMLPLVDGRRMVTVSTVASATSPAPTRIKTNVWLLRADGTQILPTFRSPDPSLAQCVARCIAGEVLYRFSIADARQAVAAAIQVGENFYIERLATLEPAQNAPASSSEAARP